MILDVELATPKAEEALSGVRALSRGIRKLIVVPQGGDKTDTVNHGTN